MAKKTKAPRNPTAADLPQNPEFQAFAAFTGALMRVPKADLKPTPEVETYEAEASHDYGVQEEADGRA